VDDADARRHLHAERDRLEHLRSTLDGERLDDEPEEDASGELSHADQHLADAASDAFEREKEFTLLDQVDGELTDVDRALERLSAGTYGRCEACGGAIGDERLEVVPAARFCIEHQADVET
jgi:RNA polymerase-binding transcription factor DksA